MFKSKLASATGTPIIALNSNGEGVVIDATGKTLSLKDGSDRFASRFWYDELGRLCLSQNAKQFNIGNYLEPKDNTKKAYSYTLYDAIGRIIEVGEVITSENVTLPLSGKYESQVTYKKMQDFVTTNTRSQITRTYYDEVQFQNILNGFTQNNLRTRVASVSYQETPGSTYKSASHYSYDVHGNVKTLIVEISEANSTLNTNNSKLVKRLDYDYDLISGKVNTVTYQASQTDQFIHRYEYDSDNRITKVFTSKDGVIWDNDAKYQYYAHGPLARTVTGELAVENQNFAYTLQGWIKGLNGQNFSYALGYNSTDYTAIGTATNLATPIATGKSLFNGNIVIWTSNNKQLSTNNWTQQFEYDQLNRIMNSKSTGLTSADGFKTTYTYNPNGSVQALTRTNEAGVTYDDFKYHYQTNTEGYKENTNKLRWIDDPQGKVADDLADQSKDNYTYDEIGSMIAVNHKDIQNIEWNLIGKMKRITYKPTSTLTTISTIDYNYNPSGNKVAKTVTYRNGDYNTTYFVHDASGNTMATYELSNTQTLALNDQSIYGSSRLGVLNTTGRNYELSDHLGNVRTTINELGIVQSANDYLPFGKLARSFHPEKYDFSFNGKLKENEFGGQDYGMRPYMEDEIIFPKPDPLINQYPFYTPYQFAGNKPILAVDLDGAEELIYTYTNSNQTKPKITNGTNCSCDESKPNPSTVLYDQVMNGYIGPKPEADNSKTPPPSNFEFEYGQDNYLKNKGNPTGTLIVHYDPEKDFYTLIYNSETSFGSAYADEEFEGAEGMLEGANVLDKTGQVMTATGVLAPVGKGLGLMADGLRTSYEYQKQGGKTAAINGTIRLATFVAGEYLDKAIDGAETLNPNLKEGIQKTVGKQAGSMIIDEAKGNATKEVSDHFSEKENQK